MRCRANDRKRWVDDDDVGNGGTVTDITSSRPVATAGRARLTSRGLFPPEWLNSFIPMALALILTRFTRIKSRAAITIILISYVHEHRIEP